MSWLSGYLAVINFITWIAYGLDKGRAKKGKWRISERNLLILTAAGGSAGAGTRRKKQNLLSGCRCCLWRTACLRRWLPSGCCGDERQK